MTEKAEPLSPALSLKGERAGKALHRHSHEGVALAQAGGYCVKLWVFRIFYDNGYLPPTKDVSRATPKQV